MLIKCRTNEKAKVNMVSCCRQTKRCNTSNRSNPEAYALIAGRTDTILFPGPAKDRSRLSIRTKTLMAGKIKLRPVPRAITEKKALLYGGDGRRISNPGAVKTHGRKGSREELWAAATPADDLACRKANRTGSPKSEIKRMINNGLTPIAEKPGKAQHRQ